MHADRPPTLQEAITALQAYWAELGCVLWQPYYIQVGAGTMNPATFLRVLGPEPWRVAYVEPSIRPADARYGENPNRMGTHYQFQVILKPDPGNPQELYLRSLLTLGIDPQKHDIRFVEDNWEAPALGAWGLGWEVWLDGQEITQFTYFQQAGGLPLDPVSVELTYGMERILMALQGAQHFSEIRWNQSYTYGDLLLQAEREHSTYYFEIGDVERLRTMFTEFYEESKAALDAGLVLPAYDYLLKCSHTFNLLDSRAAVGVTERATLFKQMRDISREVAQAYRDQREGMGYPWMGIVAPSPPAEEDARPDHPAPTESAPFLLEIGVEELPPDDLEAALTQLAQVVPNGLQESRLEHGAVRIHGTPRRLVVHVEDLAPRQTDLRRTRKGPPADRAFDASGTPTQAAIGFAASCGLAVEQLTTQEIDDGSYVVAEVDEAGEPAGEVLSRVLPTLIAQVRFDRPMQWNGEGEQFSRPIRWLLALHGSQVVPFKHVGLDSGAATRGLRFQEPETWIVGDPGEYLETIAHQGIILEVEARRNAIWKGVQALATEVDGSVAPDPRLLAEVTHLVEAPTVFRGEFDPGYLELPDEVLVSVMKLHQRYFPVERGGSLIPYFIAVRNGGGEHLAEVIHGNESVIRARFADAAYFIERDQEQPLETYRPHLERLIFHAELGTVLQKVTRVESLVSRLADELRLSDIERQCAARAAFLSKADLATQMVIEMTSLQGAIGKVYALASGEPPLVAEAIQEHYFPRFAGDRMPESRPGMVLGLADRLDTLMGLFAVGMRPSGTSDPYALRRAAIGLIQLLVSAELRFDLEKGLRWAGEGLPVPVSNEAVQDCMEFITNRQQGLLLADGHRYDVVEAVLAEQAQDPASADLAVKSLEEWVQREDWPETLQAYARCARITRTETEVHEVDPGGLKEPASKTLFRGLEKAERATRAPGSVDDLLHAFRPLIPSISRFFDDVLVMAEEEELRKQRLGLLQRIVRLAAGVADLSRLEGF